MAVAWLDDSVHVVRKLVTVNGGLHVARLVPVAETKLQEHVFPVVCIQLRSVMRDSGHIGLGSVVGGYRGCGPVSSGRLCRIFFAMRGDVIGGRCGERERLLLVMGR